MKCECVYDGYCPRYGQEMRGRMRQICRGVDVDMGTAEVFRQQWRRERAGQAPVETVEPTRLVLRTDQAPGDALVMTAAIYSLHRAHPGKFLTAVDSPYPEIFHHNPDTNPPVNMCGAAELRMHYPAIHAANERGVHFMQGYCEFLSSVLGVPVPLLTNRPRLYFASPPVVNIRSYWVVCSSVKSDFTAKRWGHDRFQHVIWLLLGEVDFVQVGIAGSRELRGVDNEVGTNLRELFDVVRGAEGVLCGVSLLMHVAAALEKPCVVVAGGREPQQWNSYPQQHWMHTVGQLPCCTPGACWKSRVVPAGDNATLDGSLCAMPVLEVEPVPRCMTLVTPEEVAEKIRAISAAKTVV